MRQAMPARDSVLINWVIKHNPRVEQLQVHRQFPVSCEIGGAFLLANSWWSEGELAAAFYPQRRLQTDPARPRCRLGRIAPRGQAEGDGCTQVIWRLDDGGICGSPGDASA
jgi:hypothetical protein